MVSDKFEEMAEKIASKAVEKFQRLQSAGTAFFSKKHNQAAYRVSESEGNSKENTKLDANISEENENNTKAMHKAAKSLYNAEELKKKEAKVMKNLGLKFKKFTKGINERAKEDVTTVADTDETLTNNEKISQEEVTSDPTTEFIVENNDLEKNDDSDDNDKKEVDTKKEEKDHKNNKTVSKKDTSLSSEKEKNESKKDSEYSDSENEVKKESGYKKVERRRESDEEGSDESTDNQSEEENTKTRKPIYQLKMAPENDSNVKKTGSVMKPVKSSAVDKSNFEKKPSKTVTAKPAGKTKDSEDKPYIHKRSDQAVRREGNKLFIQEKHADYEDYHEELARIQKQLADIKIKNVGTSKVK